MFKRLVEIGLSNLSVGQCVSLPDHTAALRSLRSRCLLDVDAGPGTMEHLLPCSPSHHLTDAQSPHLTDALLER